MSERRHTITIEVAARKVGVSPRTIRRYVRRGMVGDALTEEDMATLRRIRRLTALGVNLAGAEVVLRMRRQIEALRVEIARLEALVAPPLLPGGRDQPERALPAARESADRQDRRR